MYECGWMRKFPFFMDNACKLARMGYKKAKAIIMTNPDLYYTVEHMLEYLPRTKFIPFAIHLNKYEFKPINNNEQLIFFSASRMSWNIKGTDKLVKAWSLYIQSTKMDPLPKLWMVAWGDDVEKTKALVASLPKKVRETIEFSPLLSKPKLVEAYHTADVVCDQFILGSYGTAAPEAMACGRPVLMYLDEYYNKMCYGDVPPVANAYSVLGIAKELMKLEDYEYRRTLSLKGHAWAKFHHNPSKVAEQHKRLYEAVL